MNATWVDEIFKKKCSVIYEKINIWELTSCLLDRKEKCINKVLRRMKTVIWQPLPHKPCFQTGGRLVIGWQLAWQGSYVTKDK
jgi:hypothetical protein